MKKEARFAKITFIQSRIKKLRSIRKIKLARIKLNGNGIRFSNQKQPRQISDHERNPEERKFISNLAQWKRQQVWQSKINVDDTRCQITKAIQDGILDRIELNEKGSTFGNQISMWQTPDNRSRKQSSTEF